MSLVGYWLIHFMLSGGIGIREAVCLSHSYFPMESLFNRCFSVCFLQCSAAVGMKAFFDMMDQQPRKVMILGGSCTSVTDSIAKTSKHWRIPVVRTSS